MRSVSHLCICIAFVIAGFCGAVTADIGVNVVDIRPTGDLESGITDVVAGFTIELYPVAGETMASNENIRLTTELENPSWGITLILDGIESKRFASPVRTGDYSTVDLTAWEFSYPTGKDEKVRVELTGKTPRVTASKEILVVSVDLVDTSGRVLNDAKRAMKFVLNPDELLGEVSTVSSDLSALQLEIDKTAAKGINVGAVDAKYDEAQDAISKANAATYADAQIHLQNAENYIRDAYALLDKTIAESDMVEVQATIDSVDEWITYFQDNGYTSDSRLVPIVQKREFASEDHIDAKAAFNKGDYSTAREKTQSAQARASDAFESSQAFFAELEQGASAVVTAAETKAPTEGEVITSEDQETDWPFIGKVIAVVIVIVIIAILALFYLRTGGGGGNGKKRGGGGKGKARSSKSSKHQYDELF